MKSKLFVGAIILFALFSLELKAQREYLGYSVATLDAMASEGDDLEAAKIERFKAYLDRLDQLKLAFSDIYEDPKTEEALLRRVNARLDALAALRMNALDYRGHMEQEEYAEAAVSFAMYQQSLDELGLRDYFDNLFSDLEEGPSLAADESPSSTSSRSGSGWREMLRNGGSPDPYNLWFSLGAAYNLTSFNSQFNDGFFTSDQYTEDMTGGVGLALNLGYAYNIFGPISIFTELGILNQSATYSFTLTDSALTGAGIFNEERAYNLTNLAFNIGLNYYYKDYDFKLGIQYMSQMSATLNFSYDDGFNSDSREFDLSEIETFKSSQTSLFVEASYDFYEFEVADNFLGLQVFLRPHLSFTDLIDDPQNPEGFNFKMSQIHFGLRLQY